MDQVYNTLTRSLKQTTEDIGGEPSKAFARADRFTAGVAEKLAPLYSKVEKLKDEEGVKVFNLLQSGTKEGTGQVKNNGFA